MEKEKKTKEQTFYVAGMHCASCEIIIEKKLIKQDGVEAVDVSLRDASVRLVIDEDKHINIKEINKDMESLGYRLSKHPVEKNIEPLFIKDKSGKSKLNKKKANKYIKNFGLAVIILIAFIAVERMQLGRYISVDQGAALSAFLILGLVASISSCAALIGGVLLSLSKHWHEQYGATTDRKTRKKPHIMFHVGRLGAFFILGGVLGLLGDAISLDNTTAYATLVIVISVIMFLIALQMLGIGWAQRFAIRLPKFFTRVAAKENTSPSFLMPTVAGGMTFFLPCGFTLIAQGAALASGSAITGALIMFFFAIGTLPVLASISLSGVRFTSKPHLAARFSLIAGVLILFFAIYNINGQLNVLGYPSLSDITLFKPEVDYSEFMSTEAYPAVPSDQQRVSLIAKDFNYILNGPATFSAGVPTKLLVDNQGVLGCGAFLASRGLLDGFVSLNRGQNLIDIGTPRAGTYKITCSMGMVPPVSVTFK